MSDRTIPCISCSANNSHKAIFCSNCGQHLSPSADMSAVETKQLQKEEQQRHEQPVKRDISHRSADMSAVETKQLQNEELQQHEQPVKRSISRRSADMSAVETKQLQNEEPQQHEQPVKRSISRRSAIGLACFAGAVIGGATLAWFTLPHSIPFLTQPAHTTYQGHSAAISSVAWSPDGTRIVSASLDKTVRVWKVPTGEDLLVYTAHSAEVYGAVWSTDGTKIASAGKRTVQEWHAVTGAQLFTYNTNPAHPGHAIAWSPHGNYLAIAASPAVGDNSVQLWNVNTHQIVQSCATAYPYAIAWSSNAKTIAVGTAEGKISILNIVTGDAIATLQGHQGWLTDIAWSHDGVFLASTGVDGTTRIWEVASGKNRLTLTRKQSGRMNAVAWSPDGKRIVSGGNDGAAQIWGVAGGKALFLYKGHTGPVTSLMWSPDGKWIVSGGEDHSVQVWPAAQ